MLLLTESDIRNAVSMKEAIEVNKEALRLTSEWKIDNPLRTVLDGENGKFLFMPVYSPDKKSAAVKVINIFPQNREKGLETSAAQVLLIDGETGSFEALLDGTYLTKLRTGASTGAAFDLLARKDSKTGALIGSGSQAESQLEAMLTVRDLSSVRVYSPNRDRRGEFVKRMQEKFSSFRTEIISVESSDQAIIDADMIVTVTVSPTPVFNGRKVKEGAVVSCVGTYEPDKREMDPEVLKRASKIICDFKLAALSESGDLRIPIEEGIITEDDVTGSLGDVINGKIKGRENDSDIIVYESVGVAAQDLLTAKLIYDRATERGSGFKWDGK